MADSGSLLAQTVSHYRFIEKIDGGMGVVYHAQDKRLERDVAVRSSLQTSSTGEIDAKRRI